MFFQNVDEGLVPNPSLKRSKNKSDTKIKHTHYVQREGSPMNDSTLITIAQHSPTDESFTVTIADNTFNIEEHEYKYPRHVTFVILVLRQLIEGMHPSSGVGYQIKEDNVLLMSTKSFRHKLENDYLLNKYDQNKCFKKTTRLLYSSDVEVRSGQLDRTLSFVVAKMKNSVDYPQMSKSKITLENLLLSTLRALSDEEMTSCTLLGQEQPAVAPQATPQPYPGGMQQFPGGMHQYPEPYNGSGQMISLQNAAQVQPDAPIQQVAGVGQVQPDAPL